MSKHTFARPALRLATLSAALWLAGCSFIPTFSRPVAPVAPAFPQVAATSAPAASAKAPMCQKERCLNMCILRRATGEPKSNRLNHESKRPA